MKMRNKNMLAWVLIFCLTISFGVGVAYAGTKKTIKSVYLYITSEIETGTQNDYVKVISQSNRCWVDETEVTNVPKNDWESDDKPRLKITLRTDEDYSFVSGISKSKINLSGDTGKVTSISRKGDSKLIVYVTLDSLEGYDGSRFLDVDDLEWDEKGGTAYWSAADDADRYEVRLFRNDLEVTGSTIKTSNTYYDFSSRIIRNGYYTFKVRAVYNKDEKGDWKTSDRWYASSADASQLSDEATILPAENKSTNTETTETVENDGTDGIGWIKEDDGWRYINTDHSYLMNTWKYIDQNWYYFNGDGYMETSWTEVNGKWYFMDTVEGYMYKNQTTPDGYRVGDDGAWIP